MNISQTVPAGQQLALAPPSPQGDSHATPTDGAEFQAFGADGFTFDDFLDVVNPLQHIPFVSTLYRSITGDAIDPGSRIAGGTLFGGPIGAGLAVANVAVEHTTGRDMGEHVMALFEDDGIADTELANNEGPAETAHRDVQTNIEVRQWAERETAFHAAQAAAMGSRTVAERDIAVQTSEAASLAAPSRGAARPLVATQTSLAVQALAEPQSQTRANGPRPQSSPGAPAAGGGWFSDTMTIALNQYQQNQRIADFVATQKSPGLE